MGSDNFCLRWNDFESNISTSFVDLRHKQEFFDVTLSCDHGNRQVQAHKVILAACSPFFRKVLARNPHQNPLIYLKGIDYDNLSAILNFMYHGEVNVAQEDLSGFLKVAEELAVKGLTDGNKNNGQESPEKQPQQTSATKKVVKKNPLKRPPMLQPAPNALGKSSPSSLLVPGTHQNSSSSAASNKTSSSSNNSPMVSKKPKMSSASSANYDDMQPHVVKPDLENSQDDDGSEEMEDSFGGGRFAQDGGFGGGDGGEFLDESMADEMGGMTHGALDADGNKDSPFVFGNITTTTTSASLSSSNAGDDHDEIDAYIRTDGSGGLFWCAVCDKKTRFKNSIRRHIEGIHFSRTYTCELCQEVFKARYMLTRHIAKYHN